MFQGNKDNSFVEERTVFLDKFIKDICLLPYLYESIEFQTFLRPQGDLEKAFAALPKQTTDDLLSRFREVMPVNEVTNLNLFTILRLLIIYLDG